jgi:hypothetical protein
MTLAGHIARKTTQRFYFLLSLIRLYFRTAPSSLGKVQLAHSAQRLDRPTGSMTRGSIPGSGKGFFLYSKTSTWSLRPTQPSI